MSANKKRLEILRSKFARQEKNIKNKNWKFTGESIIIQCKDKYVEIFENRFAFDEKVIFFSTIKEVFWLGRNRIKMIQENRNYKQNNYGKIGFELDNSTYFEITNLSHAYDPFLTYLDWIKYHGDL